MSYRLSLILCLFLFSLMAEPTLLTIQEAEELALEQDHQVRLAELAWQRERFGREIAVGQLLPSLGVSGAWRRSDPNGRTGYTDRYNSEVRLSQLIFSLPVFHSVRTAHWDKEAAFWNYMDVRQEILFRIREAHYRVIVARRLVEIQQRRLDLLKEGYENEAIKVQYGESTAFDFNRNRLEYTNALEVYYSTVSQMEQALDGWIQILGVDPEKGRHYDVAENNINEREIDLIATLLKRVSTTADQKKGPLISDGELYFWEQLAAEQHPLIRVSEANARGASRQVEEEKGRYLPELRGFTSYNSLSGTESLVTSKISYWEGGIEANWVILDGFRREHEIKRRQMQAAIQRTQNEQDRYEVTLTVRDRRHQLQEAVHAYTAAINSQEIAERSLVMAKDGLELGSITALEYRDMIQSLTRAESSLARARFQLMTRYHALIRALGLEEGSEDELLKEVS